MCVCVGVCGGGGVVMRGSVGGWVCEGSGNYVIDE